MQVSAAFHSFGEREVLRGIDLQLHGGEIYGLLGPNGAGKTTLMKAICGRLRLTSGTVAVDGRDPLVDRQARRAISFVPQEISIYPHLTVEENLQIFGRFSGVHGRDLVKAVEAMLRRAGLDDRSGQLCRTLSGGYQRRVNICASLLQNPVALVLDEPTVGIDVDAREALHELLDGLRDQGAALLLATHDLEQAQLMCDRIGVMHEGRICVEGEPAALLRRAFGTDKEVVVAFRASPSDLGRSVLRDMDFKPTQSPLTWFGHCAADRLDAGALGQRFAGAELVVKEIRIREPDLASLFRDTLGRDAPP